MHPSNCICEICICGAHRCPPRPRRTDTEIYPKGAYDADQSSTMQASYVPKASPFKRSDVSRPVVCLSSDPTPVSTSQQTYQPVAASRPSRILPSHNLSTSDNAPNATPSLSEAASSYTPKPVAQSARQRATYNIELTPFSATSTTASSYPAHPTLPRHRAAASARVATTATLSGGDTTAEGAGACSEARAAYPGHHPSGPRVGGRGRVTAGVSLTPSEVFASESRAQYGEHRGASKASLLRPKGDGEGLGQGAFEGVSTYDAAYVKKDIPGGRSGRRMVPAVEVGGGASEWVSTLDSSYKAPPECPAARLPRQPIGSALYSMLGEEEKRRVAVDDDDDSDEDEVVAPKPAYKPAARPALMQSDDDDDSDEDESSDEEIQPAAASAKASAPAAADKDKSKQKRPFSMVPSFKHLLGGSVFPGLRVDQTCVFQFSVGEPEKVERKGGIISDSFYAYKVTTTTSNPEYLSLSKMPSDQPIKLPDGTAGQYRRFVVKRRYNDFQWLRQALVEAYPGVPVSPVPEKDNKSSMDRVFKQDLQRVLEYRQRGLRKFLTSIGSHPVLAESDILRAFLTLPRDETSLGGAPLKNAPGSTARTQAIDGGKVHEGGDVVLQTEDFSHFTLYRDAWTAADKAKQQQRGDGSIARKLGSLFSRSSGAKAAAATAVAGSGGSGGDGKVANVNLSSEIAYFQGFREALGETRDDFAFVREVHKLTEGALREISVGFKYLSFVEKVADPFLSEEFKGQEGAWKEAAELQCDLLESESKMVMDGFYHYYNWASEILTVLESMATSLAELQALEKKVGDKSAPTEVARLEYLRTRCRASNERISGEIDRFHASKEEDFPNIMRVFVAIMSDHTHKGHAVFQKV